MTENNQSDPSLEAAKEHTRNYAKDLWSIINRYRKLRSDKNSSVQHHNIDQREENNSALLQILSLVPYLLVILFLISFFWDFNGISIIIFGHLFYFNGLLRILSVSGLIGFLTNWVAITMLFKPAQKRPLLGQGLIPAQKNRIAFRLAQAVSEDLINPEIIKKKIHESDIIRTYRKRSTKYIKHIIDDPSFRTELKQWMINYVNDMIGDADIRAAIAQKIIIQIEKSIQKNALERVALKAYSFIKGQKMQRLIEESLNRLPESVETGLERFDEFLDDLPSRIESNSDIIEQWVTAALYKLINQLDVHALVEDNLRQYDEQHLSDIILKATNEQLRYIQYLGGILGVAGGFIIWEPLFSLVFFIFIGIIIFLFDNLLLTLNH